MDVNNVQIWLWRLVMAAANETMAHVSDAADVPKID